MTIYNRVYSLEFGRPVNRDNAFPFVESELLRGGLQSLLVTQLRVQFKTKKTGKSALNEYEITVYNMSEDNLEWIASFRGEEVYVRFQAGYADDEGLKTLCVGTIQSIESTKEGDTRKTVLVVKDGYTNVKESRASISHPAGTPYSVIFNDLREALGVPLGIATLPTIRSAAPWAFHGPTYEGLKALARELGYRVNIGDQLLNFIPEDYVELAQVRLYTPTSGIVGDVTSLDNSSGNLQGNTKEQKVGIKFKVLLNGSLKPDTLVQIQSRDFNGTYKLTKVEHSGDTRGNDWYTMCEAVEAAFDITAFTPDLSDFTVGG